MEKRASQKYEPALTAGERDLRAEAAVLGALLAECPEQLTVDELICEMVGPNPGFKERDEIERAIRTLEHVGLLHREGKMIWPSRAARYLYLLELE